MAITSTYLKISVWKTKFLNLIAKFCLLMVAAHKSLHIVLIFFLPSTPPPLL